MARQKTKRRKKGSQLDLEAIGLVLLAVGIFILGMLVPALPTGDLGRALRGALFGSVGWGAYALPWPFLLLGSFFLLRRSPKGWPRVLAGYAVVAFGLWLLIMLLNPEASGSWGRGLRRLVAPRTGWLAYLVAFLVVTLGAELVLAWRPTHISRTGLRGGVRGVQRGWGGLLEGRRKLKERAAFGADVALTRKALRNLDKDLAALRRLYPGSAELGRWRGSVEGSMKRLEGKTDAGALADVQADLGAWQDAVSDFTLDRAAELRQHMKGEGIEDFEGWAGEIGAPLEEPIDEPVRTSLALDTVRKTLALDLTALEERYRRLTRERDAAESSLKGIGPRALSGAFENHHARIAGYKEVAEAAEGLEEDAAALSPWRTLNHKVLRLTNAFGERSELTAYGDALVKEFGEGGRDALGRFEGWQQALAEVELVLRRPPAEDEVDEADEAFPDGADEENQDGEDAGDEYPSVGVFAGFEDDAKDGAEEYEDEPEVAIYRPSGPGDGVAVYAGGGEENAQHDVEGVGVYSQDDGDNISTQIGVYADEEGNRHNKAELPEVGGIPPTLPSLELLDAPAPNEENPRAQAREVGARVAKIDDTLANFKLAGRVVASVRGPTVTRFEVEPAPGEKISRFANLSDDLALAMAVGSVRIEAPIPGKSVIGLEVPNADRDLILFREAAESASFKRSKARLPLVLGKSIDGETVIGDLARMPHLLIAGSTGSGKSVAVNTLVGSLLYKFLPTELRFLMIDPKMVELTPFDGIPHLLRPVVTNPNDAAGVLLGAVAHMERRYKMMSKIGAKNLDQYNVKARTYDMPEMPFIIIIIDELADLMITSPKEVESAIMRLAQMARATGMHLVLATQRPSVDILTSLIKVNVPARVAFAVSSGHDSRTILDTMGAERLTGMGDMLFYQPGLAKPVRLQGPYISETEVGALADFLRRQFFDDDFVEAYGADFDPAPEDDSSATGMVDWNDDKLREAAEMVINEGQASVSRLQRRLSVGHARAGKLMDSLEALGVVGAHMGSKPREVLVEYEELPDIFGK